jgi:hypothetical protein
MSNPYHLSNGAEICHECGAAKLRPTDAHADCGCATGAAPSAGTPASRTAQVAASRAANGGG